MPYIANSPDEISQMLKAVGAASVDDLFADILPEMRPKSFDVPDGMDEMGVTARFEELAAKNNAGLTSFAGGGYYDHYIPAAVDALSGRAEFYTAYTPYQAEASQGTLQAIFEYQTAVCRLLEMDCANASMYEGGTALFEAAMMAVRQTKRSRIVVDEAVNPLWRSIIGTMVANMDVEVMVVGQSNGTGDKAGLMAAMDDKCAAVIVQNPNFFGVIADYSDLFAKAKEKGVLSVLSVYPLLQSVLKTPGEMGADIAVAEGQSLGLPLSFGGPYLGIMTCRKEYVRQLPGRIVGKTKDRNGRDGYVLTLQAREQHIRRAKATSNICSNQALCALRALIYMSLLGPEGMTRTAGICLENAQYAAKRLTSLKNVSLVNSAVFGNEFAVRLPVDAARVVQKMSGLGVVPGLPLGHHYPDMKSALLVACTEKHTRLQIDAMATMLEGALK